LFDLVTADRASVLSAETASVSALRLLDQLPRHPIVTIASAMQLIAASKPTATRAIEALLELGILAETTGRKRDRSFAYRAYMEQLRSGTELDGRG
jgi:Fic family protein